MAEGELAVIFDMDGVLVDTYWAHFQSWNVVAGEEGTQMSEERFAATFGRTSREIIALLWPELRDDAAAIQRFDDRKEEAFRRIIAKDFPAMPGVERLLEGLAVAGILSAIGSSGPAANVALVVEKLGTKHPFRAIVTGDDVNRGKPDPEVFLLAAERLRVPPRRCVVVEDAPPGLEAAKAAQMRCVGMASTGRTRDELSTADLVVDSLDALGPDVFRGLVEGAR